MPFKNRLIGLRTKGFLLLLVPALLQIVVLVSQVLLYFETEFYPQRALREKDISDVFTRYILDNVAVLHYLEEFCDGFKLDPRYEFYLQQSLDDREKINQLWRDYPAHWEKTIVGFKNEKELAALRKDFFARPAVMDSYSSATGSAVETVRKTRLGAINSAKEARQALKPARFACQNVRRTYKMIVSAKQPRPLRSGKRAQERQFWMCLMVVFSLVDLALLVAIGLFFTREILSRIAIVLDNSDRVVRDVRLNERLNGSDEIARLDMAFHEMAAVIGETARTHKAVLEHARDLVCSIDEKGVFSNVSQSAESMLGYYPRKLIGTYFLDIVAEDEQETTAGNLLDIVGGGAQKPFETKVICRDNSVIDLQLSASWSDADKTMFCVAHDISQQKAADRLQQEVVQMVSHDLKSPLAGISIFHELLEEGVLGELSVKGHEQVRIAQSNTQRMINLVNDLLEIERIKSGMLQLERDVIQLNPIFKEALSATIMQAQDQQLVIEIIPTVASVYADKARVLKVITNLLLHSIAISPPGTKITLSAEGEYRSTPNRGIDRAHLSFPGFVRIDVRDESPVIPEHFRKAIFSGFSSVGQNKIDTTGGAQLKLATCRALVTLHGGIIDIVSAGAIGNIFSFCLPADRHASLPQEASGNRIDPDQ